MLRTAKYSVGYYGRPGGTGGKVHLLVGGVLSCGQHLAAGSEFQWCANGVRVEYIECKKCKHVGERLLELEALQRKVLRTRQVERVAVIMDFMRCGQRQAVRFLRKIEAGELI